MGPLKAIFYFTLIHTGYTATTGAPLTECGGEIYSTYGQLASPLLPYPAGTHCLYTIATGEPFYITATHIDTGLGTDLFKVTDTDGIEYTAADLLKYNLHGSWFKVEFKIGDRDGFNLEWDAGFVGCNKTINSTEGMLHSPGYPFQYANNMVCVYSIHTENVTIVTIDDLNIQNGKDLLQVSSLNYRAEVEHMFYTGDSQYLVQIGRKFEIVFTTDSTIGGRGFHLNWKPASAIFDESYEDPDPHGCGGIYMGSYGYLESPNFPDNYYSDSNCFYDIYSDHISDLVLEIEHLKLAPDDVLVLNASSYKDPLYYYSNYSIKDDYPPNIIKNTEFTMELVNSDNDTASGFRVSWTPASLYVDPTHKTALGLGECSEYYTTLYGSVSSINYPKPYPNYLDCYYTINTTVEIELFLHDFYVEEKYDSVEVRTYNGSEFVTLRRFTGLHKLTENLKWTGHVFQIYFQSDSVIGKRGFRFVWRPVPSEYSASRQTDKYGIEVSCGGRGVLVNIPPNVTGELFPGVDDSELTLIDPTCTSDVFSDMTQLWAPFMTCGMTREETDTHIVYKNVIRVAGGVPQQRNSSDSITRSDNSEVKVECRVNRVASGIGYYWPEHDDVLLLRGYGNFSLYMDLFRDSNHTVKFTTYPKPLELNQDVFVDIGLMADDPGLKIAPKSCIAKPSMSRHDFTDSYDLISSGCPSEDTVYIEDSPHQNIYFRFRTFEFLSNKNDVYIFCYVTVCKDDDDNVKECFRGCNTHNHRRRRDALKADDNDLYIVQGPLRIRHERDVLDPSEKRENSSSGYIPAIMMAASAVAMVLAAVVIVIAKRRA